MLVQQRGGAATIAPILIGMRRPLSVLQHGTTAADIVSLAATNAVVAGETARPGSREPAGVPAS